MEGRKWPLFCFNFYTVPPPPHETSCYVNRTFSFDETNNIIYFIFWRDGDEHVHVVRYKVPLAHPTLLLPGQFPQNFTHMHA